MQWLHENFIVRLLSKYWILLIFFLTFSPCLIFTYVYHNDLDFWMHVGWVRHVEAGHLVYFSRPVGALLLDIQTNLIRMVPDALLLNGFRVFILFNLILMAAMLDWFLKNELSLKKQERVLVVLGTFLQPSWLLAVIWCSNYVPMVFSHLLGLAAGLLLYHQANEGDQKLLKKILRIFLAGVLLAISVLSYPPAACAFFWPLCLVYLIRGDFKKYKGFFRDGIFFGVSAGAALLFHRFVLKDLFCNFWVQCGTWIPPNSREYSLTIVSNFENKQIVFADILKLVMSSWAAFTGQDTLKLLAVCAMLAGLIFEFSSTGLKKWKKSEILFFLKKTCFRAVFLFLIFLILNSPNFVTEGSVVVFRTIAASTILLGIAFLRLTARIAQAHLRTGAVSLLCLLLVVSGFLSAYSQSERYSIIWNVPFSDPAVSRVCAKGPAYYSELENLTSVRFAGRFGPENNIDLRDFDLPIVPSGSLSALCHLQGF